MLLHIFGLELFVTELSGDISHIASQTRAVYWIGLELD